MYHTNISFVATVVRAHVELFLETAHTYAAVGPYKIGNLVVLLFNSIVDDSVVQIGIVILFVLSVDLPNFLAKF